MVEAFIKKLPVVFVLGLVVGGALGVTFGKHALSWVDAASFEKRADALAKELNAEKDKLKSAESKTEQAKEALEDAKGQMAGLREQTSVMVTKEVYDNAVRERDAAVANYNELKKPYDARSAFIQKLREGVSHPCSSDFLLYRMAMYSRDEGDGDVFVTVDNGANFRVHSGPPQVVTIKDIYAQVKLERDKRGCQIIFGIPPM